MSLYVLVIPADSAQPARKVEINQANTLSEMQALVGGYIEPISIDDSVMFINEEGKYAGLGLNRRAVDFLRAKGVDLLANGDFIVGDAVVCSFSSEGETTSLLDRDVAIYQEHGGSIDNL